jgi:hypothetical protein
MQSPGVPPPSVERKPAPPRLFGIPALRAPIVAVLRRGPTDWCHVGRWDLEELRYEPGAWFRGTVYPQKCDLSPDGRWLAYSALKPNADWEAGEIYSAISRLPWMTALAAWEAGTTYTRGIHFDDRAGRSEPGRPDVGDAAECVARYGLAYYRPVQFAVERRRGWVETADTEPRRDDDLWDQRRQVRMEKCRPGFEDGPRLVVEGSYAGFRTLRDFFDPPGYSVEWEDDLVPLDGVQWADWDASGRLLIATTGGALEVRLLRDRHMEAVFRHDLADLAPASVPGPAWAREW